MKKPIHYLVFKLLAVVFGTLTVVGIVLAVKGFGDFESNNFMIGGMMSTFGLVATIFCALTGFRPEIVKASMQSTRYIQQQNKEEMRDIATTQAEIHR